MKISVITVCYNAAATIGYTLESFFAQDHADKELVVVDGASTDGTVDIVRGFAGDGVTIVSEPDEGMYHALNKGLALYTGDAIGVLNADDRFHDSTVLGRVAEALDEADMVHGHLDFVGDHETCRVVRRWRGTPGHKGAFRKGWMPAHPTFYVRRRVAEAVGLFDIGLRTASDYDWMLRAHELHDFRSDFVDHVMIDMLQGGRSTASWVSHVRHNLEALRSRRRWIGAGRVDYAFIAKPARKIGQFVRSGRPVVSR